LINQQQLQPGRTAFNDQKKLFEHPMAIKVLEVCVDLSAEKHLKQILLLFKVILINLASIFATTNNKFVAHKNKKLTNFCGAFQV
jgi:hypothetical protein